jgi:DNA-directed RNA polymerase specialized sigma subunit
MDQSNQLKEKTDNHLVNQIKLSQCNSSLSELINRHSGICVTICQRYSQVLSIEGVSLDELKDNKDYVIYQAALSYNNSKNIKFSSWLGNCMKYHCLNTINSNKKKIRLQERYSAYSPSENENQNLIKKSEDVDYINSILSKLKDKRIGEIYALRYSPKYRKPLSWKKISERMGISSQTAINLHDKGRLIINKKANSKEIVDSV